MLLPDFSFGGFRLWSTPDRRATLEVGLQKEAVMKRPMRARVLGMATAVLLAAGAASAVIPGASAADAPVVVDRAAAAGLYAFDKSWAAAPVDYDGDGDQDVLIGYHQWTSKLWSNNGNGVFTRVAADAWPRLNSEGKVPDRHDCAWADVDRDGRPDAYCSAGRNQSNLVKYGMDNELWLQRTPGHFTEVGTAWGVGDLCGRGRHVTFINANGDEFPDLFLGNSVPRKVSDPCDNPANGLPNELSKIFLNNGGTGFTYWAGSGIAISGPGQRCAEVLDFNHDGWDDLLACRFATQTPRLYRNNAGQGFSEVSSVWGLTTTMADAVVVDLNGDGVSDLVTASARDISYRLNLGSRFGSPVRVYAVPSGREGRSVAVGDADGDGDLDIYAMTAAGSSNPPDVLLLNVGGLSFTPLAVPSATGQADEAIALDPEGNGRAQFLVLNGGDVAGPVQLMALQP
jgi:enediyne biosynthesis protein E4